MTLSAAYCSSSEAERESAISSLRDSANFLNFLSQVKIVPQCGDGLWYRVAYINMSDSTQEYPSNWTEISTPVRTCGRPTVLDQTALVCTFLQHHHNTARCVEEQLDTKMEVQMLSVYSDNHRQRCKR